MSVKSRSSLLWLVSWLFLAHTATAQVTPSPGAGGSTAEPNGPPIVPAVPSVSESSVSISAHPATAPVIPQIDSKAAVNTILTMFEINQAVNVEATGKPLPVTGSWAAQPQLPDHPTRPCALAQVPCVNVLYRVPETRTICIWTLGLVKVAEPQSDGTIRHATHQIVLDENDAAARYTLRKAWSRGEAVPKPTVVQRPDYPAIARTAQVGGAVVVRLVVGPDGLVKSAFANGPQLLQPAVVEAVKHWKFEPLQIGQQPTSFQLDQQFNYDAGHASISAGMEPTGGGTVGQINDPHNGPGIHTTTSTGGTWQTCDAAGGCSYSAPPSPR